MFISSCSSESTELRTLNEVKFEEFFTVYTPKEKEGCKWVNTEEPFSEDGNEYVRFRYMYCPEIDPHSVWVSDNSVKLAIFDIIMHTFSIFAQEGMTQRNFVLSKIQRNSSYEGVCEPIMIRQNVWTILDDMSPKATYATIPCGYFGRDGGGLKYFFFKRRHCNQFAHN